MPKTTAALAAFVLALFAALQPLGMAQAQTTPQTPPSQGGTGSSATGTLQSESTARVDFGNLVRFQLRAASAEPIRSVLFLYQVDDSTVQNTGVPGYQPGPVVLATYDWRVAGVLVPGSEVRYQWQIELQSGKTTTTAEQTITYNDTRFNWRETQGDRLTVYYRDGEPDTGQALLEEARRTQASMSKDYGLTLDKPVKIYAYTRQQDYVSALSGRPQDFATGVNGDRIFVLAPSGTSGMTNALKSLRRELANAVFVQKTRNPYADPPHWLSEGFGLVVSGEEISQDNYKALGQVAQQNKLLPLKTLNGNFPNTDRDRVLAYVESVSAVKFMLDTYGPDKIKALFAAFKEGNTVDDAFKKGLGATLDQVETRWKNALKSGAAAKPNSGQRTTTTRATGGTAGDGVVDRLFGPAVEYWQRILGPATRPVLLGVVGLIGVGVLAIIGSVVFGTIRRARAEEE